MIPSTRRAVLALIALIFPLTIRAAAEDVRNYETGPLTADDFRGKAPANSTGAARTSTQLRFTYQYGSQVRDGQTTLNVASVTVDAYVRRGESWNRRLDDKNLLEHEQGHADIAWIQCLKARIALHDKIHGGRKWTVTAPTLKEAGAKLERELTDRLKAFEKAGREADAEYDRETRHGLGARQTEWRRVQVETIKRLQAEWNERL